MGNIRDKNKVEFLNDVGEEDRNIKYTEATFDRIIGKGKNILICTIGHNYFKFPDSSPNYNEIINTLEHGRTYMFIHKNKTLLKIADSQKYIFTCKVKGLEVKGLTVIRYPHESAINLNTCRIVTSRDRDLYIYKRAIDNIKIDDTYEFTCNYYHASEYTKYLMVCDYKKIEV